MLLEAARQEVDPLAAQEVELARGGTMRSRRSRQSRRIRSRTTTPDLDPAAARSTDDLEAGPVSDVDSEVDLEEETRAIVIKTEEPGIDSLRMTGGAIGTIIRARRRATALSAASETRSHLSASTGANGSIHSHEMARNTTRRSSLSPNPRPSWFKALTGRRAEQSRSPARTATSNLPEVSEKPQLLDSKEEVSGLPPTMTESPISASLHGSGGQISIAPSGDSSQSARFLSSGELVSSPLLSSTPEEVARRPSVRFQSDTRAAVSAPNVPQLAAVPIRPSLSVEGEDAAAMRSRTLPSAFTAADRLRAEEILREKPAS